MNIIIINGEFIQLTFPVADLISLGPIELCL